MDRFAIGVLLYSGLWTLGMAQEEYRFVMEMKNWTDAQQHCRTEYADLATIVSDIKFGKNNTGDFWMGYHDRWQWSLSEGEADYRNWEKTEPNNFDGPVENCAMMGDGGKWFDGQCKTKRSFMCYNVTGTTSLLREGLSRERTKSTNGFPQSETGGKYILVSDKKCWVEAQRHCRKEHTDLVSVRSLDENDEVHDTMGQNQWVWIGLSRGSWRWSDETNSSFENWMNAESNKTGGREECALVRFDKEGRWDDKKCDEEHSFLCYDDKLVLVTKNYTWAKALEHCREKYGDLVTISSSKLQHWVSRRARKASTSHVWLGLSYTCTLDFWFWVSEESLCFSNWRRGFGRGREECGVAGALDTGGDQWVSHPVTDKLNFICEKYPDDE